MTVKDLIELLQECKGDELVCVYDTKFGDRFPADIADVSLTHHGYVDINFNGDES